MEEPARREQLKQALVHVHNKIESKNDTLRKRGLNFNFITPRDYISFLGHF